MCDYRNPEEEGDEEHHGLYDGGVNEDEGTDYVDSAGDGEDEGVEDGDTDC